MTQDYVRCDRSDAILPNQKTECGVARPACGSALTLDADRCEVDDFYGGGNQEIACGFSGIPISACVSLCAYLLRFDAPNERSNRH